MTVHLTVDFKGDLNDTVNQLPEVAERLAAGSGVGGCEDFVWRAYQSHTLHGAVRSLIAEAERSGWESLRFNARTGHISRAWSDEYDLHIDDLDENIISEVSSVCLAARHEDCGESDITVVIATALHSAGCHATASPRKGIVGVILPTRSEK